MHQQQTLARPEPITPWLWRVGGGSWNGTIDAISTEGDANVYLLRGPDSAALIDCAALASVAQIEGHLRTVGVEPANLTDLLLTHSHWDHTEATLHWQTTHDLRTHLNAIGAEHLARDDHRLVGSPLHGPDYVVPAFAVHHAVADGETFALAGIDVTARFLPGHTLDSTLYTFAVDDLQVGVCGDILFGRSELGTYCVGLLSGLWGSNLDRYVESLHALEQLPLDLLVPGHGGPVVGREAVAEAVAGTLAVAARLAQDFDVRRNTDF